MIRYADTFKSKPFILTPFLVGKLKVSYSIIPLLTICLYTYIAMAWVWWLEILWDIWWTRCNIPSIIHNFDSSHLMTTVGTENRIYLKIETLLACLSDFTFKKCAESKYRVIFDTMKMCLLWTFHSSKYIQWWVWYYSRYETVSLVTVWCIFKLLHFCYIG